MEIPFAIIAALTIVAGIAAMSLRKLVHCALCLALVFAGLAAMYLQLGAQFVGFAQILVYIGAVAILVVFAILLTNSSSSLLPTVRSRSWVFGLVVAVMVFATLVKVILASSTVAGRSLPENPLPTVKDLGTQMMTYYILPLEVMGLLLTAATIGAVIIAMQEKKTVEPGKPGSAGAPPTHH